MKASTRSNSLTGLVVWSVIGLVATVANLQAVTVAYEGFDIPAGEIDFTTGTTSFGWRTIPGVYDFPWEAINSSTQELYHGVQAGSLEYPGLPTVGNAFIFTDEVLDQAGEGGFNSATREIQVKYSYSSAGQLWFSALVNPKITGDPSGGGWFQVCLSNNQNDVYLGLANTADQSVWSAGGERLKLDGVEGQKWAYSEFPVEDGETAFLVMHLDFDAKEAYFYVNPPVDAEDPGTPVAMFTMWTDLYLDKVRMWILNSGPSVDGEGADYIGSRVDEIRLGTTYQSVAAGADLTDPGTGGDTTPPVITGPSGAAGAATSTADVEEHTVKVADMIADETVNWTITGGTDADFFTIGSGSGGLSFAEYVDYEIPRDSNADNVYVVEVTATDSYDNASSQTITVTVLDSPNWYNMVPDANGWIDTDAPGPLFLGWVNVAHEPYIWIENLQRYVYIREAYITKEGTYAWMPLDLSGLIPSDWAYWMKSGEGKVDTGTAFIGMLDVNLDPWIFSELTGYFIYLPAADITQEGSWLFFSMEPADEQP
jgi:hypothetical protein